MKNKQKEAIENLTNLLNQRNEKQVQITTYDLFGNIETVLNMIKENSAEIQQKNTELAEKNAEIENLKADNKKAWELNANMSQRHLSDILKIKKKDRQIDLMAKSFKQDDVRTVEEIKQYFEELAERKSEK